MAQKLQRNVVAAPVNASVPGRTMPARQSNAWLDIADGLSSLTPALRDYSDRKRRESDEADAVQAQVDVLSNPDADILPDKTKAYLDVAMKTKGKLHGARWAQGLNEEYETAKTEEGFDLQTWMGEKFSKSFGGDGHDNRFLSSALPAARLAMFKLEDSHAAALLKSQKADLVNSSYQAFAETLPLLDNLDAVHEHVGALITEAGTLEANRTDAAALAIQAVANEAVTRGDVDILKVFQRAGPDGVVVARHPKLAETLEAETLRAKNQIEKNQAASKSAANFRLMAKLSGRPQSAATLAEYVEEGRISGGQAFSLFKTAAKDRAKAATEAAARRYARENYLFADKAEVAKVVEEDIATLAAGLGEEPSLDQMMALRIQQFSKYGIKDDKYATVLKRGAASVNSNPDAFLTGARIYERALQMNHSYAMTLTTEKDRTIYDAYIRRTRDEGESPENVIADLSTAGERVDGVLSTMSSRTAARALVSVTSDLGIAGNPSLSQEFRQSVKDSLVFNEATDVDSAIALNKERWEKRKVDVAGSPLDVKHFGSPEAATKADAAFYAQKVPQLRKEFTHLTDVDDDQIIMHGDEQTKRDGSFVIIDTVYGKTLGRTTPKQLAQAAAADVKQTAMLRATAQAEEVVRSLSDADWVRQMSIKFAEQEIETRGLPPEDPAAQAVMSFWMDPKTTREALKQGMLPSGGVLDFLRRSDPQSAQNARNAREAIDYNVKDFNGRVSQAIKWAGPTLYEVFKDLKLSVPLNTNPSMK